MPAKSNTSEFIEKAKSVHGDRYDYSITEYKNSDEPVTIICCEHGPFTQRACNHLLGRGCRACATELKRVKKRTPFEDFLSKAKEVHGDKYIYNESDYTSISRKMLMTCRVHGAFNQTPAAHTRLRQGCPECANERKRAFNKSNRKSTEEFIAQSNLIHDGKYSYEKCKYVSARKKVIITCKEHGDFEQVPYSHLSSKGCPKCAIESGAIEKGMSAPGWGVSSWHKSAMKSKRFDSYKVYLIVLFDDETWESFIKVGRTYNEVKRRFAGMKYNFNNVFVLTGTASEVYEFESMLKAKLKEHKFIPKRKFGGMHECFSLFAIEEAISIFEKSHLERVH